MLLMSSGSVIGLFRVCSSQHPRKVHSEDFSKALFFLVLSTTHSKPLWGNAATCFEKRCKLETCLSELPMWLKGKQSLVREWRHSVARSSAAMQLHCICLPKLILRLTLSNITLNLGVFGMISLGTCGFLKTCLKC